MKVKLLPPFYEIFDRYKPQIICEIGTHDGKTATQFIDYCVKYNPNLKYVGFDIFDAVKNNSEFHKLEINGKGAGKYSTAKNNIGHRKNKHKKFTFVLHKGFTQDTLKQATYDFVYIDGGHSYETVKHDFYKVQHSKVIVFDDYQTSGVRKFFDELIDKTKLPFVEWNEAFDTPRPCYTFLPHKKSLHEQPVIFNE